MKDKLHLESIRIAYPTTLDIFKILESLFITLCDLFQETN
jgi:hypothetical protein